MSFNDDERYFLVGNHHTIPNSPVRSFQQAHRLKDCQQVGSGGEGTVLVHPEDSSLCVKIFHVGEMTRVQQRIAKFRAQKVSALCLGRGLKLPPQFLTPITPVTDYRTREVIGYTMQRAMGNYHKLKELLDTKFRQRYGLDLRARIEIFTNILQDLETLHRNNIVVGDVNLGCILFDPVTKRVVWVDTDSWSIPGYPSLATTERFAHPDLYPNLQGGGASIQPQAHHDNFAFTVLFTSIVIPGAHPFGMGQHPSVRGMQNRTKAKLSIFDNEVTYPKICEPPGILSDELLHALQVRLHRTETTELSPLLLADFANSITDCGSCGTQYPRERPTCPNPRCQQSTPRVMPSAAMRLKEVYKAPGAILAAEVTTEHLNIAYLSERRSAGIVRIARDLSIHRIDYAFPYQTGERLRFFGDYVAICDNLDTAHSRSPIAVYDIAGQPRYIASTNTGLYNGQPVSATSNRYLYRLAGDQLVRSTPFASTRAFGEVIIKQTRKDRCWFNASQQIGDYEVLVGYNQLDYNRLDWFVVLGDADGTNHKSYPIRYSGLRSQESVESISVYFSKLSLLILVHTIHYGEEYIHRLIVDLKGQITSHKLISAADPTFNVWSASSSKIHQGPSVLHATANGIVKEDYKTGQIQLIEGTEDFASPDYYLLRFNNQVVVMRNNRIDILERNQ